MSPDPERPTGRPDHVASHDEVRRVLVIRALPGLGDLLCAGVLARMGEPSCPGAKPHENVALSATQAGNNDGPPRRARGAVAVGGPSVVVYGGADPSAPRRRAPLETGRHRAVLPADAHRGAGP